MPFEVWGATGSYEIGLPGRPLGNALLLVYVASLLFALYHNRQQFRQLTKSQWAVAVALWGAAFVTSQLFPIRIASDSQLAPLGVAQNPVTTLTLLTAVPLIFAAATLNPVAALITGLFSGLGQSLGQTHQFFDIFHYGLAGLLAGTWLRQSYSGWYYRLLRQPIFSGSLSLIIVALLTGVGSFAGAEASSAGSLAALDLGLSTSRANLLPLLLEGLIGGFVVTLILRLAPDLRPGANLRPSPESTSLQRNLLGTFLRYAAILGLAIIVMVFALTTLFSTQLVVNQMAHDVQSVSTEIPLFQARLQNMLLQFSEDDALLSGDSEASEKALGQMFRSNPMYRRILLVNDDETISAYYPTDGADISLTDLEQAAIANVLTTNAPDIATTQDLSDEHVLSFMVPVLSDSGRATAVLVGRVPELSLNSLIVGLQGTVGQGLGFVVDENGRIIAHPDSSRLHEIWSPPIQNASLGSPEATQGVHYQGRQGSTNARELVYYRSGELHGWTTVITVPFEVVLRLSMSIGLPLALVMTVLTAGFYVKLHSFGHNLTQPIVDLVQASRTIAAGGTYNFSTAPTTHRDDELGQLHQAFAHMQRSLKNRLDELSLLLSVSHDVATSLDINHSMPALLRGVLRGTGAAGARAIVFNPSGGMPLTFGEGPSAHTMDTLDRQIALRMRTSTELALASPEQIRQEFDLPESTPLPIPALVAFALYSQDRLQGVLWIGYRKAHRVSPAERNLLRTLASQASLLVDNARLYATADSGWRRLAAVLASASEPVIVTDQSERVLLINRNMERVFDLKTNEVIGRSVADVIRFKPLVKALTGNDLEASAQEIIVNERTYYANTSTIINNDEQTLGRVAVLTDITHYKEVDQLKSEFVSTVSHDLRSPLTFMRGYTTMLPMMGELNETQKEYIEKILGGIDRMAQMVNDLLDLGRIEAGVAMLFERVEIAPLLNDIAEQYWQHTHMNGIQLQLDVPQSLSPVFGDVALLRQAVTNYLDNGIKYAQNSGKMILRAEQANGEVVISVKDLGPGMPKEVQLRVFEKFYRDPEQNNKKKKGSGLGLALVKSIAEKHGGRVWCQSELGEGSTFYISIPVAKDAEA